MEYRERSEEMNDGVLLATPVKVNERKIETSVNV